MTHDELNTLNCLHSFIFTMCSHGTPNEPLEENLDIANQLLYALLCKKEESRSADLIRSIMQVKEKHGCEHAHTLSQAGPLMISP